MLKAGIVGVRNSQDLTRADLPLVARYCFVPPAWIITVAVLRLGVSPNAVTALRAGLVLVACALIVSPFLGAGLALFLFAVVLDHVDGNLCRLQDRATYFGKFLDGLADMLADLLLLPALATHVWLHVGVAWVLAAAMAGALGLSFAFLALYRVPLIELMAKANGAILPAIELPRTLAVLDKYAMNAVFDIRYATLPIFLALGALVEYIVFIAGTYVLACILVVTSRIARARRSVNIARRSRSLAHAPHSAPRPIPTRANDGAA
jgi:phosphatidylglycerophosphate synthase